MQARGPDPEKVGARRVGGPKGGGPNPEKVGARRVGARRVGGPKFSRFFRYPATISLFLFLSGGLLVELWWCFEALGRSNVHVWSSLVVV